MALVTTDLVLMAHGANFKSYVYESTADTLATIEASGYFDSMAVQFRTNDILTVTGTDGARMYKITATATVVTLGSWDPGQSIVRSVSTTTTSTATIGNSGIVLLTPTSVSTGLEVDVPYAGADLTIINNATTSSKSAALAAATNSKFNVSADGTATLKGAGGVMRLLGLSSSEWAETKADITPSTSPDVKFS